MTVADDEAMHKAYQYALRAPKDWGRKYGKWPVLPVVAARMFRAGLRHATPSPRQEVKS